MGTSTPLSYDRRGTARLRSLGVVIGPLEAVVFGPANGVPAAKLLVIALAPDRLLAHQAARAVEAGMAPWRAERVMLVLDRLLQFRAAA
jgi:hypothetical protein